MAKANNTHEDCEWRLTKGTTAERIEHLYRNPLMADVYFMVTDKGGNPYQEVTIPSHKFVLVVTSPVFFKMFYGALQESTQSINLLDCDSEGFLEFSRFVYCDEVQLTRECVVQVLYLAEKYMIPSLKTQCRSFLLANIDAENVLDVLPAVHLLEEAYCFDQCCKIVDAYTETILQTAPVSLLEDHYELLVSLLKGDTLQVEEIEIFKPVNRWAGDICEKRELLPSGKVKRKIIGETILKLIRFPLMTQEDFAKHVPHTNILTVTEVNQLFMYFTLNRKPGVFSCDRRRFLKS